MSETYQHTRGRLEAYFDGTANEAWQRLIQVLRHEINNSLAPINSLADSLRRLVSRKPMPGPLRLTAGGSTCIGTASRSSQAAL